MARFYVVPIWDWCTSFSSVTVCPSSLFRKPRFSWACDWIARALRLQQQQQRQTIIRMVWRIQETICPQLLLRLLLMHQQIYDAPWDCKELLLAVDPNVSSFYAQNRSETWKGLGKPLPESTMSTIASQAKLPTKWLWSVLSACTCSVQLDRDCWSTLKTSDLRYFGQRDTAVLDNMSVWYLLCAMVQWPLFSDKPRVMALANPHGLSGLSFLKPDRSERW